ncbi:MAG: glycosyltransferase family 25 protein [Akkermansia sp.]|nr:glycosyltransferase family 25 protein [Akkermansia sp.]
MSKEGQFWDYIDGVCVINLDHRTDRWQELSNQLNHVPTGKVHRISAIFGKKLPGYKQGPYFAGCTEEESLFWAGRAGCLLSHRKCIQYAKDNQWERVLILEDDAVFHDALSGEIGQMLVEVMQTQTSWQMFFLGSTPYHPVASPVKHINTAQGDVTAARIMGPLCAHCYIVHSSSYDDMLKELPTEENVWEWQATHLSYDSWIANEFGRESKRTILGCYPNLCSQGLYYSDIEHREIQHGIGALGEDSWPVTFVDSATFASIFRSPRFVLQKWMKLAAHAVLGMYYRRCGYRKFTVSIQSAGYWGALKAALGVLKRR